jgi:FlaA1/EpsC-like NDP-sugar epimerase
VTVTHPAASRYFLTLREAVDLILTVTSLSEGGVIFVPELGSPVKIVDLAERLIRKTGMESAEQIKIVFTELRPGEKLTEELFSERESLEPTVDARLYKISGPQISGQTLDMLLHKLHDGVLQRNLAGMMETLCSIVPEYQPSETLLELLKPSPA